MCAPLCGMLSLTILLTTPSSYPCGWSSPLSSLPFTSSVREEAPPWSSLCPLAPSPWSGQVMELSELRNGVVDERQKGVERAAEGGYMNTELWQWEWTGGLQRVWRELRVHGESRSEGRLWREGLECKGGVKSNKGSRSWASGLQAGRVREI